MHVKEKAQKLKENSILYHTVETINNKNDVNASKCLCLKASCNELINILNNKYQSNQQ